MKIFDEEEVQCSSDNHSALGQFGGEIGTYEFDASELRSIQRSSYKDGVEYAESKVEDLCIEFAEYYYDNCDENGNYEYQFQQFLKERNNEKI